MGDKPDNIEVPDEQPQEKEILSINLKWLFGGIAIVGVILAVATNAKFFTWVIAIGVLGFAVAFTTEQW